MRARQQALGRFVSSSENMLLVFRTGQRMSVTVEVVRHPVHQDGPSWSARSISKLVGSRFPSTGPNLACAPCTYTPAANIWQVIPIVNLGPGQLRATESEGDPSFAMPFNGLQD